MVLPNVEGGGETEVTGLVDPGYNVNFILEKVAEEMRLTGTKTTVQIKVVNEEFTKNRTKVYHFGVKDHFKGSLARILGRQKHNRL